MEKYLIVVAQFIKCSCLRSADYGPFWWSTEKKMAGKPRKRRKCKLWWCSVMHEVQIFTTVPVRNKVQREFVTVRISLKAPTSMHLIRLGSISPTRFGALPPHHQGLRISCCQTEHAVVYRCTSSIWISRTAFMFSLTHCRSCNTYSMFVCCYSWLLQKHV